MKKFLVSSAFVAAFALLAACGDNADSTQDPLADLSSSSGDADAPDVESAETQEDLPSCTARREGKVQFVEEDEAYFVCLDGTWEEVDDYSATEEDLPSCSARRECQVYYVGDLEESLVCKGRKWVEYDPSDDGSDDEDCDEDEEDCDESGDDDDEGDASSSSKKARSSSSEGDPESSEGSAGSSSSDVIASSSGATQSSSSEAVMITGECGFSTQSWSSTVSSEETLQPGSSIYFVALSQNFSNWDFLDLGSELDMDIYVDGTLAQTMVVSKWTLSSKLVTAPSEAGAHTISLVYGDVEVCSAVMNVVEPSSSSSSVIASSSSANESSSSEAVAEVKSAGYYKTNCPAGHTCKDAAPSTYLKAGITYGEILDTRDDQVYKTVEICDDDKSSCQTWMAQNLNYKYNKPTSSLDSSSFCYGGKADSCAKYGRLYLWSAAMDSAGVFSTSGKGCGYGKTCSPSGTIRGICPEGWHLPSLAEWKSLLEPMATSVDDYSSHWNYNGAGRMLKSEDGWSYYSGSEDIDYYGFSALPAGIRDYYGGFGNAGYYAYFWSSSEYNSRSAYSMYLYYSIEDADLDDGDKSRAFSVRCVQN